MQELNPRRSTKKTKKLTRSSQEDSDHTKDLQRELAEKKSE
jgi:hypothetical protein